MSVEGASRRETRSGQIVTTRKKPRELTFGEVRLLLCEGFDVVSVTADYQRRGLHLPSIHPAGWFASLACTRAGFPHRRESPAHPNGGNPGSSRPCICRFGRRSVESCLGRFIRWRSCRHGRSRSAGVPTASLLVSVHIMRAGEEKAKEGLILESASLRASQKTQVLLCPLDGERIRYLPLNGDVAKGSLRSVIVPRDTIVVEKRKQRIPVTNEPLNVSGSYLALWRSVKNHSLVKTLNGLLMLSQVPCFQTEALSVIQNRSQQIPEGAHKAFVLCIKRVLP